MVTGMMPSKSMFSGTRIACCVVATVVGLGIMKSDGVQGQVTDELKAEQRGGGFSVFKPGSGQGVLSDVVSGLMLATGTEARRVAVRGRTGWELWNVGDGGDMLDTGHAVWSDDGKTLRIEWEKAESEEFAVSGHGELPWGSTGQRHEAFRLSDWLIARKEPVGLPFLGGENIALRFGAAGVVEAEGTGGEQVNGRWWWSRGLLHVRLGGFDEVATYEWRPLARHVGWNSGMSAPVVAEVAASPPSPLEGASPPPRRLPGAAAVCNRDVLGALLKTATESSDVVSALGIEKQTILLCRDRQQLVVEIVQAEKRLAELIAESVKAKTEQAPAASVVRTVAQLVAAKAGAPAGRGAGKLAAGSAGELSGDVIAPEGVAATVGSQAPAPKARKVTWSWFSMLGREGRLIAGVTNGSGAWFVAEGERVPGVGLVKRISARPPVVEVAGVGMLGWVEGPPRPGEEKKGSEGLRRPAAVLGPVVEDALDRVVERVFGRGGGEGQAGGVLKGRADTIDGDTLRMGEVRIRLWGIDAPERDQVCRAEGLEWACGRLATAALRSRATDISCRAKGRDGYGRVLAVCFDRDEDVNAWLVSEGWALAYRRFARDYVGQEDAARKARKGMHRGQFIEPWHWRRGERFGRTESRAAPSGGVVGAPREQGPGRLPPLPGEGAGR